jgi:hypothetical protein
MGIQRKSALAIGAATLFGVVAVGGLALADGDRDDDRHRGNRVRLRAELSGANEVPAADPDGDGSSRVELFVDDGMVCFSVRFDDTGTPNRGHIHVGVAGANGGIVVPLFELGAAQNPAGPADPANDRLESRQRLENCVAADPAVLALIKANPSGYYVNLHNARFPGGAIRGQLD